METISCKDANWIYLQFPILGDIENNGRAGELILFLFIPLYLYETEEKNKFRTLIDTCRQQIGSNYHQFERLAGN
jgi:hypothetical protein